MAALRQHRGHAKSLGESVSINPGCKYLARARQFGNSVKKDFHGFAYNRVRFTRRECRGVRKLCHKGVDFRLTPAGKPASQSTAGSGLHTAHGPDARR